MNAEHLLRYAEAGVYTMQGRLAPPEDGRFQSFPRQQWAHEIERAAQVPLRGIEWIYDVYGAGANPLETEQGRADLSAKLQSAGVAVVSICADYFMDCPFVRVPQADRDERIGRLRWLLSICPGMGINRVVLPFVDASKMADAQDAEVVLGVLHAVLPDAQRHGVELHLETDLDPQGFKSFLDEVRHSLVKVNYDSGNSSSLGYAPADEFAAYGDRIGSFHIKDRVRGGGTVPLGTGDCDFDSLRSALIDVGYRGDFVMQVARGPQPGDEVNWLRQAAAASARWLRGQGMQAWT